jgi:hypothetical protein
MFSRSCPARLRRQDGFDRATRGPRRANVWRSTLRKKTERLGIVFVSVVGMMTALATPASAATNQISGVGVYDTAGECPDPPPGYEAFVDVILVLTGSLDGCLYTDIVTTKDNGTPSGVYQERGEEVFVTLDGGSEGTFGTTYKFSSKWDPDVSTGPEVHGRCEHPIVAGSGTGGFAGATGRLDFKDDVVTGEFFYRGHITLP